MSRRWAVACWAWISLVGCGGGQKPTMTMPDTPKAPKVVKETFTSKADLAAIVQKPPTPIKWSEADTAAKPWTLTGPFPEGREGAALDPVDAVSAHLSKAQAVATGQSSITASMTCAAREVARYIAQQGQPPASSVERFIAGRCGSPETRLTLRWAKGRADEGSTDEAILEQWSTSLKGFVEQTPEGQAVGMSLARAGDQAALVWVGRRRRVKFYRVDNTPNDKGEVVVQGESFAGDGALSAAVNHGQYESALCTTEVTGKRFKLVCPVRKTDASTWISLHHTPTGRLLGTTLGEALIWPQGGPQDTYTPAPSVPSANLERIGDLGEAFTVTVNRLREAAGRPPLTLDGEQSAVSQKSVGHFFAASGSSDGAEADRIALGLMAGWSVAGNVRSGRFRSERSSSNDLSRTMSALLERPWGRRMLLDTEAARIAVGGEKSPDGKGFVALITTYQVMEEAENAEGQLQAVTDRITELRGGAPVRRLTALEALVPKLGEHITLGLNTPKGAMYDLMDAARKHLDTGVQAWRWEGGDLSQMPLPAQLKQKAGTLSVAVVVSRYRPAGSPWHRYVVLLAWPDGRLQTAAR
ncbi:MAG: CAP domain-containing protein [Bradymonadia bacterium]